ncbi:MAG TPA: nuclear transport factor 2 family protein [Candidatus Binataceae bacterium]|nr:nuclear transport factor 2 family protein [Candidatus Binataceae bacterium]
MSESENKSLIRQALSLWAAGNANAFFDLLADDVRWTVIGSTRISRAFTSKRAFLDGAVQPLMAQLATPIKPSILDVIAEGDKVVVQWDGSATAKNGKPYNQRYCWVIRVVDGRVREGIAYLDTELVSQLWS